MLCGEWQFVLSDFLIVAIPLKMSFLSAVEADDILWRFAVVTVVVVVVVAIVVVAIVVVVTIVVVAIVVVTIVVVTTVVAIVVVTTWRRTSIVVLLRGATLVGEVSLLTTVVAGDVAAALVGAVSFFAAFVASWSKITVICIMIVSFAPRTKKVFLMMIRRIFVVMIPEAFRLTFAGNHSHGIKEKKQKNLR